MALICITLASVGSSGLRLPLARTTCHPRAQPVLGPSGIGAKEASPAVVLGSFPFPLTECLVPGQSKQLHLYETRMIKLLEHALETTGSLATQMAFSDEGSALAICSLVSIESVVQRDVGINVVLRAVGRVRITEICEGEPFIKAKFVAYADTPHTSAAQRAFLTNQLQELYGLHQECSDIGRRMVSLCAARGIRPPFAATDEEAADEAEADGEIVSWGHELTRPDSGFNRPLEEQLAETLAAIVVAKDKASSATGPQSQRLLALLGGTGYEEGSDAALDTRFSLASLLACACFPTQNRLEALCETESAIRMDSAISLLTERRAMLAAKLALVEALCGGSSEASAEPDQEST